MKAVLKKLANLSSLNDSVVEPQYSQNSTEDKWFWLKVVRFNQIRPSFKTISVHVNIPSNIHIPVLFSVLLNYGGNEKVFLPFSVMNIGVLLYLSLMYITMFSIPCGTTKKVGIAVCIKKNPEV